MKRIEDLAQSYTRTERDKNELYEVIAGELYRNPVRFGFEDADAAAEALMRYGNRIRGLIDRYVPMGASFETYLGSCLRYMAKSMRRFRQREKDRHVVCERAEYWNEEQKTAAALYSLEEFSAFEDQKGALPEKPAFRRRRRATLSNRLIFLFLKCAWYTGDAETRQVARAAGVSEEWLALMQSQSRHFLEAERNRYETLAARRDKAWSHLRTLELKASGESDKEKKASLEHSISKARSAYAITLSNLKNFKPLVPNIVVARILGVPKGTVDSGIHFMKHHKEEIAGLLLGLAAGAKSRVDCVHGNFSRNRQCP